MGRAWTHEMKAEVYIKISGVRAPPLSMLPSTIRIFPPFMLDTLAMAGFTVSTAASLRVYASAAASWAFWVLVAGGE